MLVKVERGRFRPLFLFRSIIPWFAESRVFEISKVLRKFDRLFLELHHICWVEFSRIMANNLLQVEYKVILMLFLAKAICLLRVHKNAQLEKKHGVNGGVNGGEALHCVGSKAC